MWSTWVHECGARLLRANLSPVTSCLPPRLALSFTAIKLECSAQSQCLKTVGHLLLPPQHFYSIVLRIVNISVTSLSWRIMVRAWTKEALSWSLWVIVKGKNVQGVKGRRVCGLGRGVGLSLGKCLLSSHHMPAPLLGAEFMKVIRTQALFLRGSDTDSEARGRQTGLFCK